MNEENQILNQPASMNVVDATTNGTDQDLVQLNDRTAISDKDTVFENQTDIAIPKTEKQVEQLSITTKVIGIAEPQKVSPKLDQVIVALKVWIAYNFEPTKKIRTMDDYVTFENIQKANDFVNSVLEETQMNMREFQAVYIESLSDKEKKEYFKAMEEMREMQSNPNEIVKTKMEEVIITEDELIESEKQEERASAYQESTISEESTK